MTYHYDTISLSSSDANRKKSCICTLLTALDSRTYTSEVRASQWIPRQAADFIQDPHRVRTVIACAITYYLLVLPRNEFYPV